VTTGEVEARLLVPYRPHLFGRQPPVVLELSRMALVKDEVFLILCMIYSEAKRQERMVSLFKFLHSLYANLPLIVIDLAGMIVITHI
jgi:hypothetical protein